MIKQGDNYISFDKTSNSLPDWWEDKSIPTSNGIIKIPTGLQCTACFLSVMY